ncbi:ABC transporter substrate-binding protein [Paraburkholderia dipogonis]|uniref:ABC transporter substrate-binding protein n=1 Tax=Paraburkholderia dipogonis TaxID=1211383 RepID=UPI0038BB3BEC
MKTSIKLAVLAVASIVALGAKADETIKFGVSAPLSGPGAPWGKGAEFLCKEAAKEIKGAGGIKVKGTSYNIECIAYDNKYTATDGTKVAQTLLNRDGVKYMCAVGSAPILAAQSLTERQGALLFTQTWTKNGKGPDFPLTFSDIVTPFEVAPAMIQYVTKAYPQAKTIALLNVDDANGHGAADIVRPLWEKAGVKVLTSDFYAHGTTEFQPAAQRLAALKPDMIDIASAPPAVIGQVLKELSVLGYKGIKIATDGTAAEGIVATGGAAAEGLYMGAAITFDGPSVTEHQRKLNAAAKPLIGESLSIASNPCYDAVYMLKAGAEKAQSLDPKAIAAALPTTRYTSFYADNVGFGGKAVYGSDVQPKLPVYITQIENGKVVEKAKIMPNY